VLDFAIALIFVFYLNRWIHGASEADRAGVADIEPFERPTLETNAPEAEPETPHEVLYNSVGERVSPKDDEALRR